VKWFKMLRGPVFGIALIVVPFTTGDPFDSTRSILVSVGFMLVGTASARWWSGRRFAGTGSTNSNRRRSSAPGQAQALV